MTLSDLEVVRVVSRSYLNNTGSEFHVNIGVLNYRYCLVNNWKPHTSAVKLCISLIIRMNRNSGIPQHRFGTCCGKCQEFRS